MKRILTIVGILIMLISLLSGLQYLINPEQLSDYEKGIVTGKVILFLIGAFLLYLGRRNSTR